MKRVFLCILYNYKSNKNIITKKTTNGMNDMDGMQSCKREVNYSKCKPIGSLSLLTFDAGTIPPDVDASKLCLRVLSIK